MEEKVTGLRERERVGMVAERVTFWKGDLFGMICAVIEECTRIAEPPLAWFGLL